MDNTAEGIGARKWSYLRSSEQPSALDAFAFDANNSLLMQGALPLAMLTHHGEAVKLLLATAPQLWEAANALVALAQKAPEAGSAEWRAAEKALANMVAKAVGKQDWKDVEQG